MKDNEEYMLEFDTDDDDLDDLFGNDDDDDNDDDSTKEELTKLQASLAELEKANKGLLKEVKRERAGRQDFQGRFNELSQTVSEILDSKKGASDSDSTDSNKSSGSDKIMIEFDNDGNPYIPVGALKGSNSEILEQINTLTEAFKGQAEATQAETTANRVIQSIISKDSNYPGAYARVEAARNFLNKQIIEYQKANNLSGSVTPAQAIQYKDQLFDLETYGDKFADVDLVLALRAMDTEYDLEQALNHVVQKVTDTSTEKKSDGVDPRFKKVLSKPSGLGKAANAKGAELDATEKLANISSIDLVDNLTDADVEKITQALLREEKQNGVK